jgi:predicted dienelactone hydrolase
MNSTWHRRGAALGKHGRATVVAPHGPPRTLIAGLVVAVMALAACGADSSTDAGEASTSGSSPVQPPEVPAPDAPGPFEVGHTSFEATDPERDSRSVPVDVWYPVDAGTAGDAAPTRLPLAPGIGLDSELAVEDPPPAGAADQPLVVFSHGYEGINAQSVELVETLASHGFVVAAPEHTGNSQSSPGDPFDAAAANRVPDVSLVIDAMVARSRDPADPFFDRLDDERVGVVGHSFGAATAIGTVAGWAGAEPDPRVAAIMPVSAVIDATLQETERTGPNAGFSPSQLARVRVPVLLMGGTEDDNVLIANNDLAFDRMSDSDAVYKVAIEGATHTHFTNVCVIGELLIGLGLDQDQWPDIGARDLIEPYRVTCGPGALPIDEAVRLQNLYAVSFMRRHLLGDERYARFLTDEYAAQEPAVVFESRT